MTRTEIKMHAKEAVAQMGPFNVLDSGAEPHFVSIGEWQDFSETDQIEISKEAIVQANRVLDFLGL